MGVHRVDNTATPANRVVLVGVDLGPDSPFEASLDELAQLAESAGDQPVARLTARRRSPDPALLVGSGTAEEIKGIVAEQGPHGARPHGIKDPGPILGPPVTVSPQAHKGSRQAKPQGGRHATRVQLTDRGQHEQRKDDQAHAQRGTDKRPQGHGPFAQGFKGSARAAHQCRQRRQPDQPTQAQRAQRHESGPRAAPLQVTGEVHERQGGV